MKTPRQILIDQHRAADAKLEKIQAEVLAEAFGGAAKKGRCRADAAEQFRSGLSWIWRELILPLRKTWAGLAAIWVAIVAINLADGANSTQANSKPFSPTMLMAWQEQQEMLRELTGGRESAVTARPKRRLDVKPQSWRQSPWLNA